MRSLFSILLLSFFITCINIFAQEKELDEMPYPVGGISAIAGNVLYPESAKENKVEGKVLVNAVIDEEGNVISAEIVEGLNEECDKAAVDAIKKTKFKPGMKNGNAVISDVTIPVKFKLS